MKFNTTNPTTGELLAEYEMATAEQVKECIRRAREGFEKWRGISYSERAKLLAKVSQILKDRKHELAVAMTKEMGKIIRESDAEVVKSAWAFEFYAENAERFLSSEPVQTDATKSYVAFDPLGVVAAIMPWNFPMWQLSRFAAPALSVGNTTIFKPASVTPQSGLNLEKVFDDSGVPAGCFKTILGDSRIADQLIDEPGTDAVTFTGSVNVGMKVAERAGRNLKKTVLELGGSDPFIVLGDADLDAATAGAVKGRFINCGQSCIAAKRFIVVKSVANQFTEGFVSKVKKLRIGDPMEADTDIGPMVQEKALNEMDAQIKASIQMGANVETGGERIDRPGFFYAPTILTNVTTEMPVMKEEVFGPAAPIYVVRDTEEAINVANGTPFGLGASIWTQNLKDAEKYCREIQSGIVTVNNIVISDPRIPFGGVKKSGIGRELGRNGLLEFANIKAVRVY